MTRRNDAVTLSGTEYDALMEDRARLDWLEAEAKKSRTGVSFDYDSRHFEDGEVSEAGFRLLRYHKIFDRRRTLRDAVDLAMQCHTLK